MEILSHDKAEMVGTEKDGQPDWKRSGLVLPYFLDIFLQEFGRTTYLKKEKLNGWKST